LHSEGHGSNLWNDFASNLLKQIWSYIPRQFLALDKVILLEAIRDIGLEINAKKTKYMIMSRHPNSGQNQTIWIANESFEKVAKIKYLGDDTNKSE
jgi:hypothetical protein